MATTQQADKDRKDTGATDAKNSDSGNGNSSGGGAGQSDNLRDSPMMAHLMDALEEGTDIGHYGRLTFAMIARHFMKEDELVDLLAKQPEQDETRVRAMVHQVAARDYNPPKRERILEWQAQQDFQICPTPDDPSSCNVYSDLRFPEGIYDNINEFWEEQAEESDTDVSDRGK